jgi:hypothetical protein
MMQKTYRNRHTREELQRAMEDNAARSDADAKAEEQRQAKARREFVDTAAKTRRCSRRPNLA